MAFAGKAQQCRNESSISKTTINVSPMKDQNISPAVLQSSNLNSLMKPSVMASSSTQPVGATTTLTLKPIMTLKGHEPVIDVPQFSQRRHVSFISYFPDGKGMVSASSDKTTRQWDLRTGKEIEEAREIDEQELRTLVVSRDGQWIVTSSFIVGSFGKLQARDVKTRIVKTFEGHFNWINLIDVSVDSMLLVGGSWDGVRLWSMETGKLVAGPFRAKSDGNLGVVRFSQDSKKFAVLSSTGGCLEVWDVRTHKLDVKFVGKRCYGTVTKTPIFWTTQDKSIVAVFDFGDWNSPRHPDPTDWDRRHPNLNTIYEFDALTLEIVRAPFGGHTHCITGLALSFDCALLVSASRHDETIKLWAFESRQLLASFDVRSIDLFIFSPNSHQIAYTKWNDTKIYIYDPPPDILSSVRPIQEAQLKVCIPSGSLIC
jgi:WD40 repeat protein